MHLLYVPNMVIWLFYDIDNLLVGKLEERERERGNQITKHEVFGYILIAYYYASAWMRPSPWFSLSCFC